MQKTTLAFLFLAILFNAGSQLLFKSFAGLGTAGWRWALLLDVRFIAGVSSQLVAMMCWYRVLMHLPLTFALPVLTGGIFILVAVSSFYFFGERLNPASGMGILLILTGIIFLNRR